MVQSRTRGRIYHCEGKLHEDGELYARSLHYGVLHRGSRCSHLDPWIEDTERGGGLSISRWIPGVDGVPRYSKLMAGSKVFSMDESGLVEKLVFSNLTEARLHNITVYISDYVGFTIRIKSPSN